MKRLLAVSLIGSLLAAFFMGCGTKSVSEVDGPEPVKPANADSASAEDKAAVAQSVNQFALSLYGQLDRKGNAFFSPLSIAGALTTTYAGARGQTAEEMAKLLHVRLDEQRLHPAWAALLWQAQGGGQQRGYRLSIANSLWADKTAHFQADFLQLMKDNYVAGLQQVDYGNPADAVRQINAWVAGQTADEIAELLHDGDVTPQTRLVLVNAIYFKGEWQPPFDKRDTWEQTFHLAENAGTSVPMMYQNGEFAYFADNKDTFQLLEMPYKDSALSMVVLLPRRTDGLAAFEKDLTADALAKWLQQTKIKTVRVTLPRFHLTRRVDLGAVLRALGMTSAFDPQQADFSGMTCDRKLFVSKVVHEAWLDVNEKGSEAAAATGVAMKPGAAPPREQPIDFRADHPFLFLIRDTQSGSILFLGRMSNPQT